MNETTRVFPVVPLRGLCILPGSITHFDISRPRSLKAVEMAMNADQKIFLVSQREDQAEDVTEEDLYRVGVLAEIRQVIRMQNNIVRVLVEGKERTVFFDFREEAGTYMAEVRGLEETKEELPIEIREAMVYSLIEVFGEYAVLHGKIGSDVQRQVKTYQDAAKLIDYIANNLPVRYEKKQEVLEEGNLSKRYEILIALLFHEREVLEIQKNLQAKVKTRIDKNQKDYVLREQLNAIREELGEGNPLTDAEEYEERLSHLNVSEDIRAAIHKEILRFQGMHPNSADSNVSRGYIETLLEMPWENRSEENTDIAHARAVLNADHYGLTKVKERILEFLAVHKQNAKGHSPILCLVGPPGTGKTSIARSIAAALNRNYVRVCLGGVADEAEIRGHRRTYVGAMPGRIAAGLRTAGVKNPLMLLDEIDKTGTSYRGDISAALLEVLDGEQNAHFRDHYIELPMDLSEVLFLATANSLTEIPKPLLDRMEIIEIESYTEDEKKHIAREYLWEKQLTQHGLRPEQVSISEAAIGRIICDYTREAGVRGLERQLAAICRKATLSICEEGRTKVAITERNLKKYLGKPLYLKDEEELSDQVGVVTGLAWTSMGGTILEIEVALLPGKGELKLTGKMGEVMKESAMTALTCVRALAPSYGVEEGFFADHDIHIHIPEGAVPKDGPSAGVTMSTAILSAVTGLPVRGTAAMTGEITLRGRVLPIGGLKEKLLAAKKAGKTLVFLPEKNKADLEEIREEIKGNLTIVPVRRIEEILDLVLVTENTR